MQAPVNKVIDFCIDEFMAGIDWLKMKMKGGGEDEEDINKAKEAVDKVDSTGKAQEEIGFIKIGYQTQSKLLSRFLYLKKRRQYIKGNRRYNRCICPHARQKSAQVLDTQKNPF